ncbi:hypothetical protein [Neisseria sp.]|uniref:hypothetical protein n=1 Tax=Neisseria sp. TaxID=192066 RepID=UPI0035A1BFB1
MNSNPNMKLRWLVICLIPLVSIAAFTLMPPEDKAQYMINGIILACEATFLFKFVLFETIKHHLKDEPEWKRQTLLLFIPIFLLIGYTVYYFLH